MLTLNVRNLWMAAFLSAAVLAGCSANTKTAGTPTNPGDPSTPPTVTSVTPPDASTLVCPNTPVITATFNKAMNLANICTSHFTIPSTGAGVSGQVTYIYANNVHVFPAATLPASTNFTATITTGAKATFGHPLAAAKIWTFTTSAPCPPPALPTSAAACTYGILAATTSTNTAASTVRGDLGLTPGSSGVGVQDPPANTHVGSRTHTGGRGALPGA